MSKFSVKKPFTVLVMVVIILVLGVVSVMRMQMDLLPEINLPYVMVITTYPGASSEKVEAQVCKPMESALGTISGIKNVYSVSNENYGIVQLEFVDGTDMDSAMVKVSSALDSIEDYLPEDIGTPSIMEISMDMMASQYLAVSYDGMSIDDLSDFTENNVTPMFERQDGVASVSGIGLVEQTVQIELDPEKVDVLNNKILAKTDDAFADALEQLEDAKEKLIDSEESLADSKEELRKSEQKLIDSEQELIDGQQDLEDSKKDLVDNQKKLNDSRNELANSQLELDESKEKLKDGKAELAKGEKELLNTKLDTYAQLAKASEALDQLSAYQTQLTNQEAELVGLKTAVDQINATQATLPPGTDASTLRAQAAQLGEYISKAGDTTNMDPSEIYQINIQFGTSLAGTTSYADMVAAVGIGTLQTAKATAEAGAQALESKPAYEAEITALGVEIEVTKTIIGTYESQLKALGVSYTDIEKAKLEAASGFGSADAQLAYGKSQLEAAESQLEAGQKQIDSGWDSLKDGQKQIDSGWESIEDAQKKIDDGWESLEEGKEQIADGWEQIADGQEQIDDGWEQYYDSVETFEKQKVETLRHANADDLLSLTTLAQLIYAQNFEMPAGYIDDKDDNSWLLKVGENYDSVEDLENMVLCHIDDIGDVRICDVATVTIIDNALDTYARLNAEKAVILSIFKSSTAGTNEVSRKCTALIKELEEQYPGLHIMVMMDQGDYINIIVKSLLSSMVLGALLAVVILAIFLKDVKPTLVVALSIPLSVLTALVALYFAGVSLNMMSLSGLALGIGMLVDNSIVVMENIYRLRGHDVEAPRAAVQGAKQVTGSIVASTLTTIAVFFPFIYTTGIVNDLMTPMALAIVFCLFASLFISLTLVPAACSTLLRKSKPKDHKFFDKVQDAYGAVLAFCLKAKWIPLLVTIVLLGLSIWQIARMGIVMIPEMTSNEMQVNLKMDEEMSKEDCYAIADEVAERLQTIDGIGAVAIMAGGDATLLMADSGTEVDYTSYQCLLIMENEDADKSEMNAALEAAEQIGEDLKLAERGCEYTVMSSMMDTSELTGDGLSIEVYGSDLDELKRITVDIMDLLKEQEGFAEISNGQETPDQVIHLQIDKNKAMSQGLSVAQIYADIASRIDAEESAVTVTIEGKDMDVVVTTHIDELTYENLLDTKFEVSEVDEDDGNTYTHDVTLRELATENFEEGVESIRRENQSRYMTVTAMPAEGYNTTLLTREVKPILEAYKETRLPEGYIMDIGGEYEAVESMVEDMALVLILGVLLIYLVMVAQFQSLLSPFIVIFTVPLAFTGGLIGLLVSREQLSVMAMMGFVLLMGTVVNNGIVFVDYTNLLRKEGLDRHTALIATGKTRMRPILMTALTTILSMSALIFGEDMGSQMGKGMAIVVAGGLLYATLMTLFIIPIMYDILYKKQPLDVDLGSENLDDVPDDAADYIQSQKKIDEQQS